MTKDFTKKDIDFLNNFFKTKNNNKKSKKNWIVKNNSLNLKNKKKKFIKIFSSKLKKRYIINLIKIGLKPRLKPRLFLKKRRVENILIRNFKKVNSILSKKVYIRMNLHRKRKNVFLNFSNIFSNEVYTNYSCGHYYKRSLRRTYYAVESLLMESSILEKKFFNKFWINNKKKKRIWLFLMIKGDYFSKGFKKNIKKFIWKKKFFFQLRKIKNIQFKAHNGIRQRSKRRK